MSSDMPATEGYAVGGTAEDARRRAHAPAYPQLDALTRRRGRVSPARLVSIQTQHTGMQNAHGPAPTALQLKPSSLGYDDAKFPASQLLFHDSI